MTERRRYRTVHTDTQIVSLGEDGDGFEVEVKFHFTPGSPQTWTQPEEGPEVEIISVRPFTTRPLFRGERGFPGIKTVYLDCPKWLEAMIFECVNEDELRPEEPDPDLYR